MHPFDLYDILLGISNMTDLKETTKSITANLIGVLNQRNRDVIARRFGLKTGHKETLESIGRSYDITRERVRQIEAVSLKQVREHINAGAGAKLQPIVALAENVLERAGGVLQEQEFFQQFFGATNAKANYNETANAALTFMLTLDGRLQRFNEDDNFNPFWSVSQTQVDNFKTAVTAFTKALEKHQSPVAEHALTDWSKRTGLSPKHITPTSLVAFLSIAKAIGKGMFGHIGLTSWPEIKPRGVRDKSYLVLKKVGEPRHFRAIAQLINETFVPKPGKGGNGTANTQTVHNELIKDARFVLVGRGLYGLSEWGYKAGTVKDVLVEVLKNSAKPLRRDELVAQVLSHRLVKENTIILNLQDAAVFKKTENGYTLREA